LIDWSSSEAAAAIERKAHHDKVPARRAHPPQRLADGACLGEDDVGQVLFDEL
jgi:hypothetical protein